MDNAVFYTPVRTFYLLHLDDHADEDHDFQIRLFHATSVWIRHSPSVFDHTRDPRVIEPMIGAFDPTSLPIVDLPGHGRVVLLDEDLVPVPGDALPDLSDCGRAIDGVRVFVADGTPELVTIDSEYDFVPPVGPGFFRGKARFNRPEQHEDGRQISSKADDPVSVQMFLLQAEGGPEGYTVSVGNQLKHAFLLGRKMQSKSARSRSAAADVQVFGDMAEKEGDDLFDDVEEMMEACVDAYCEVSPNTDFQEFSRRCGFPMHLSVSIPVDEDDRQSRKFAKVLDKLASEHGISSLRTTSDLVAVGSAAYAGRDFDRKVKTYCRTLRFLARVDDEDFYRSESGTVVVSGTGKDATVMFWSDHPAPDPRPERETASSGSVSTIVEEFLCNRQIVNRAPLAWTGWWIRHAWRSVQAIVLPGSTWGQVRKEARIYRDQMMARIGLD